MRSALFAAIVVLMGNGALAAPGYDIVIVAGQSNANTVGHGSWTDPYYSEPIDARIKQIGRYNEQDLNVVPVGEWIGGVKHDGLQHWQWEPGRTGHGFALSFARRYVAGGHLAAGRTLLIVPAAHGATSIQEWLGELKRSDNSELLYRDMVARVRRALALPGENRIVSFHWSQGEADVGSIKQRKLTIAQFRQKLITLLGRIRNSLPQEPLYPIIVTKFVPTWNPYPGTTIKSDVERVLQAVSRNNDPLGDFAPTTGLISNYEAGWGGIEQEVHFSAQSMVTLGGRAHYARWSQRTQSRDTKPLSNFPRPVKVRR
jgi:hypothetical protein